MEPLPPPLEAVREAIEPAAKDMLKRTGDVAPFAVALDKNGSTNGILLANTTKTRGELWDDIARGVAHLVQQNRYPAIGFAAKGSGLNTRTGEQSKMIIIHLEDCDGHCYVVSIPFSKGLFEGQWVCAPPIETEGKPFLYGAVADADKG